MATLAATASAADSIYWSGETESDSIRYGPLTGENGGSTPAQTLFNDAGRPCGIALNPAAGKIYWANWVGGEIRVANLNGTGTASTLFAAPGNRLCGVAVDPVARKIYWANFSTNEIRVGNLNGTGASTLFTDPSGSAPSGVAIDPANNKIYWTNQFSDEVRAGNLDGSGTAADPVWRRGQPDRGRGRPRGRQDLLDRPQLRHGPGRDPGGRHLGVAQTLFNSPSPSGLAIDPTNEQDLLGQLDVRLGDPGREPRRHRHGLDPVSAARAHSLFAALLKAPVNTRRPKISGGAKVGRELTCQNGTWAPDLLASFLFRAPASFAYQVEEEWVEHRHRSDVHAQPGRRLHLHRDGHQPGRVDLADESQEEGHRRVSQWS